MNPTEACNVLIDWIIDNPETSLSLNDNRILDDLNHLRGVIEDREDSAAD